MRIAIIGSGNVGRALSKAAVEAGHRATLSDLHRGNAVEVAAEVGAVAAQSNSAAVANSDVVILAVPGIVASEVARDIASAAVGKMVIDSTNPLNDSLADLVVEDTSAAHELQRHLPGTAVVKAFNTIFAGRHGTPHEGDVPLDGFYAGDDRAAKKVVATLIESLGYRPIDVGGLRMARSLEEMALLNITLNVANKLPWQSGWKLLGPVGG